MKHRFIVVAFAILVFACFAIFLLRHMHLLTHRSVASLSIQQIQAAIQKAGGDQALQKEASKAILNYNQGANIPNNTNCPAIAMMASLVKGEIIDVVPDGADGVGVPAHVLIRRGSHFDYQFIYIFGTGSVPSTNNLKIQLISGAIYLRNTSP
jgi:hypothetical protein